MKLLDSALCVCLGVLPSTLAMAAPRGGHGASAQTARAIDELQGKFKWGMNVEEVKKVLEQEVRKRYAEAGKKAVGNAFEQDRITAELQNELKRIAASYMEFRGQKTAWEVSIIDREFAHGNSEAMMVIEEGQKKQRRFLFFYDGKLYKQFIAFDKQLFSGKSFDEFANLIQSRYGRGMAKYSLNRKGEQVLDHLEWPPSGSSLLRAVDQSNFYDTFCLVVEDRRVAGSLASKHQEHGKSAGNGYGTSLVREVSQPEKVAGDSNADIVDRITGRRTAVPADRDPLRLTDEPSKLGNAQSPQAPAPAAEPERAPKKNKSGKLDDLEL